MLTNFNHKYICLGFWINVIDSNLIIKFITFSLLWVLAKNWLTMRGTSPTLWTRLKNIVFNLSITKFRLKIWRDAICRPELESHEFFSDAGFSRGCVNHLNVGIGLVLLQAFHPNQRNCKLSTNPKNGKWSLDRISLDRNCHFSLDRKF